MSLRQGSTLLPYLDRGADAVPGAPNSFHRNPTKLFQPAHVVRIDRPHRPLVFCCETDAGVVPILLFDFEPLISVALYTLVPKDRPVEVVLERTVACRVVGVRYENSLGLTVGVVA
jgi:hypothetical protein